MCDPVLFSIYINDIPKDPNVNLAIFANDITIIQKYKYPHKVFSSKLQTYLKINSTWLKKREIKGNNAKSATILLTNKTFTPDANLNFILNDDLIPGCLILNIQAHSPAFQITMVQAHQRNSESC